MKWLVVIIAFVGLGALAGYQLGANGRIAEELHRQHQSDIVVYSASWCGACNATRQHLNELGQDFVELDMEQDPRGVREYQSFGGHGIPLVLARGEIWRGYRPSKLNAMLGE